MTHPRRFKFIAVGVASLAGVAALALVLIHGYATAFFRAELSRAGTEETVIVHGVSYEVRDGEVISPEHISPIDVDAALRLAYAQEHARRAPILGIEGTDPAALRKNTAALSQAVNRLSELQTSSSSASLIHSLYPFAFLSALANAEADRQTFLAVGSDENEARYESAVDAAIEAGGTNAQAFAYAFKEETESASTSRLSTFGGTINTSDVPTAIEEIQVRFSEAKVRDDRLKRCLAWNVLACEPGSLNLSIPSVPTLSTSTDATADAIHSLLTSALPSNFQRAEIVLASSTCVALLPGPYHFLITELEYSGQYFPVQFINELFFLSVPQQNGSVPAYLAHAYDISYLRSNPMDFYTCPEIGTDIGEMRAVMMTASIARSHPQIASAERQTLLGTVLREDKALAYLHAADTDLLDTPTRNEILAAELAFTERSAGLDVLVGQITGVVTRDVELKKSGAPFDMSAQTFFLTHSAFPSLFLTQNPSVGMTPVVIVQPDATSFSKLLNQYSTYSSLKQSIAPESLIHDIRGFYDFEYRSAP